MDDEKSTCILSKQNVQNVKLERNTIGLNWETAQLYNCTECGKEFSKSGQLKARVVIHGPKQLKCTKCYKSHSLMHTGEKVHKCKDCGSIFAKKSHLRSHKYTHMGEKPFCCQYCPSAFNERNRLTRHAEIHKAEKPHKCKVCDASFTQNVHLKSHNLMHIGEMYKL